MAARPGVPPRPPAPQEGGPDRASGSATAGTAGRRTRLTPRAAGSGRPAPPFRQSRYRRGRVFLAGDAAHIPGPLAARSRPTRYARTRAPGPTRRTRPNHPAPAPRHAPGAGRRAACATGPRRTHEPHRPRSSRCGTDNSHLVAGHLTTGAHSRFAPARRDSPGRRTDPATPVHLAPFLLLGRTARCRTPHE
ncbi:FAD-dependent monooxygenase [Streptomyces rochei]|uniref:FAD-dependent monooxygenase n=1 Tax=Streptomyces rochei TaxID=1928 RepID=UPI00363EE9D4